MKAVTSILHKVTGSQSPIRWDEHDLTLIGSGSSGRVFLGKDQSGSPIAVKEAHIKELDEVKLLQKLSHKNIVKYLGAETKEETSYILLEYVPGGSISAHLMKGPFDEDKIRTYTQQLLLGLQYLHQKEITHGDIKGANILIDADGCIKLADFGLSKQGAQLWMAPEVLLQKDLHNCRFTDKPDIWSVGCTVIEMATGDPWRGNYHAGASFLKHMEKSDSVPPIPDNLSSYGKQFLRRCLQREPNLRASASQLLEDPFITRKNFRHPSGAGTVVGAVAAPVIHQQHVVTPAAPKQRIVTPAAPKQRIVTPAAPKQRLVIPAAPKQRLVIPAAPKHRLVIPAAPKQRLVIPAAPKHRLVIPAAPKQRLVIPAAPKQLVVIPAAPKQRIVTPLLPPKQHMVTPAAPKQRIVTPSTQRVVHSVASRPAASQATRPPVHSSSHSHLSSNSGVNNSSSVSLNSSSHLSSGTHLSSSSLLSNSSRMSNNSRLSTWSGPNATSISGSKSRSSPSQHVTKHNMFSKAS